MNGKRRVVPRALADVAILADFLPRRAAVVGAEQAALVRFDDGVDALRVRRRDGDADLAPGAGGEAIGFQFTRSLTVAVRLERSPGVAAVAGDEQVGAGA